MDLTNPAPLSLLSFTINLLLGLVLSILLAWYYRRFGESLSNRAKFAPILPILAMITLVVISIVKSSLALSLGLVGALSIVRFRTAIKDPEELIFLFFAIAIGLGMGADQRIPTIVAFVIIIGFLLVRKSLQGRLFSKHEKSVYMNITAAQTDAPDQILTSLNELILEKVPELDIRRFDVSDQGINLIYYLRVEDPDSLGSLIAGIREAIPGSEISMMEQNNLLGG